MNNVQQHNSTLSVRHIHGKQMVDPAITDADFFLLFVVEGTFKRHAQGMQLRSGDLAFFNKENGIIQSKKGSESFMIGFKKDYFKDLHLIQQDFRLTYVPTSIFTSGIFLNKPLNLKKNARKLVADLLKHITASDNTEDISNSSVVYFQILTLFALIEERMQALDLSIQHTDNSTEAIKHYIDQHIYYPLQIQIRTVAQHFNISPNYFGAYFKRQYGVSYKTYIDSKRLKLIEERLLSGTYSLKQIVDELGFNDESHLTNFFKKKKNITPGSFRKKLLTARSSSEDS